MPSARTQIDELSINTIRTLAMDAIQQANSGHPGAAMALAPLTYTLYTKYLRFNPTNPAFANRDRFVLSAGHASMLLYGTLHLAGYDLSLDDIKEFRQLHSRTPGHPEYGETPGVETTTGPLGQGAATSVGMAMAEKWLADRFNRDGHELVDYRVYALLGDGCMMEGVTAEAASLAGHLKLDNLIWFYDSNAITIEGSTNLAYSDDVVKRFEAYGWHVGGPIDVEDTDSLCKSIDAALATSGRPSLIVVNSVIGRGAPTRANTAKAHGEPLGEEEIRGAKEFYKWDPAATFLVPGEVKKHWTDQSRDRGEKVEQDWNGRFDSYAKSYADVAAELKMIHEGRLPEGWENKVPRFEADSKGMATRASAGKALVALGEIVPWLVGGSADLAPSTKTLLADTGDYSAECPGGRNVRFGIREHAMGAICNGMSLSGLRTYGASFMVFTDYARPSIRLSALMGLPVTYVFTHDSIGVGEDGPTHQPIEHLAAMRAIPNLDVFRPGDANEAAMAWKHAMATTDHPVLLALSRQNMPTWDRSVYAPAEGALKGGYVLADCDGTPEVILMGTGSELQHCVYVYEKLTAEGKKVRVVSLPCWELYERQDQAYRESVLPPAVKARVCIEAGSSFGWQKYVGPSGRVIALDRFGLSAPMADVMIELGITGAAALDAARELLK